MKKLLGLILLVSWSISVWADVPKLLNYQGRLTDNENKAVADHDYTVQFRLYISETEVNSVWDEEQTISTQSGYFHTLLGQVNALTSSLFNQPLWLGVQIQGELEMTPRQQLASSPAALTVADGAVSNSKVANGAISNDKLEDGTIAREKLNADLWAKILPVGTILAWHKSKSGTPALPAPFVECNGQTLNDSESPYHNTEIPNLNGEARFLRGGTTSGTPEEDAFESHQHAYYRTIGQGYYCPAGADYGLLSTYTYDVTSATGGDETRPINMSVVWIMKIK